MFFWRREFIWEALIFLVGIYLRGFWYFWQEFIWEAVRGFSAWAGILYLVAYMIFLAGIWGHVTCLVGINLGNYVIFVSRNLSGRLFGIFSGTVSFWLCNINFSALRKLSFWNKRLFSWYNMQTINQCGQHYGYANIIFLIYKRRSIFD
jgi:hypothetical protein